MLTVRQNEILSYIRGHIARSGISPTLSEIAAGIGIQSKSAVHRQLKSMDNAGCIRLLTGRKRGIEVVSDILPEAATIPLAGRIAAGYPIEAIEGQDTLDVLDFVRGPNRYALLVVGNSMTLAGILDGDTVIAEGRKAAETGDIVVALIDKEEATIKRLGQCRDGSVTLLPEHPEMIPMTYAADRVSIQGVVVAQLRRY